MPWETLWYLVIGVSVLFYAILDGFDLGVGALHLFAKNDTQRRTFLNAIGPVWDGNEVWIVIVMGGMFAGFPNVYATIFSGCYSLLMFLIAGLIFRAVAIEFRSKRASLAWRSTWDVVFSFASILVAFVLGVLLGNMILGIPLNAMQDYTGGFLDLLHPYAVLVGCTAVALFAMHGASYLAMKTEGETYEQVRKWILPSVLAFLFWYFATTLATIRYMPHMVDRFFAHPWLAIFPLLAFAIFAYIPYLVQRARYYAAFLASSAGIALLLLLYAIGTYPVIVPSSVEPELYSLTIYNSASSEKTLQLLLLIVLLGVPLVLGYGYWIYRVFRGKVRLTDGGY